MIRGITSMYSWKYPQKLVGLYTTSGRYFSTYIVRFWQTTNFSALGDHSQTETSRAWFEVRFLRTGMLVQFVLGLLLIALYGVWDLTGGWQFGLALILSYPIVWAHALPLAIVAWWLRQPKALGRRVLCALLEAQVRRLRKRHKFAVVAVAGSLGKTSTKAAIAKVLSVARRVRWQEGNYNDRVTVPLIFFGHEQPGIFNIPAWIQILIQNEKIIRADYPYDVVVAELGTDGPGFIREFAYLEPDLAVVTAVAPEHMEYFGTLSAVAEEELAVLSYAKQALVNISDTPPKYLSGRQYLSYGLSPKADYYVSDRQDDGWRGQKLRFHLDKDSFDLSIPLMGEPGAKIALAAAAAAHQLGVPLADIEKCVTSLSPFPGRMQLLPGIKNSVIIDDTYNSSPVAVKAALDVLQDHPAPQRIAILGNMNELGDYSPQAHREVGAYCNPAKLDWVITIGPDANAYLAPAAEARGCQVKAFDSPYEIGAFVKGQLHEGAVILAKGSQNGVFAEEALKTLLKDKADEAKLVRQSTHWLAVKNKQFGS